MFNDLREERDQLQSQVHFLNSIIVDLEKKAAGLQSSLSMALNPTDDDKAIHVSIAMKKPPRMFCDICDCFDLHETEECPQQEGEEENLRHSHHGGDRSVRGLEFSFFKNLRW